jgi:exportin-5
MSLYESGKFEEEGGNDTQEVIEDMLNRNLTKEYLDVLKVALIGGTIPMPGEDDLMMDADDGMCGMEGGLSSRSSTAHHTSLATQEHVGELGNMLLACESTCLPILNTILRCVSAM